MQVIFLAYPNSREHPLPTLREEDEKTYSLLSHLNEQKQFTLHRDSFATVNTIIEFLELHRKEVIVFSFSGHAGKNHLLLSDQRAGSEGIAGLLGRCPKLKLILLNGCATAGQVERLQALPNHPVVIATAAPIGDYSAAKFGISFFRELGPQRGSVEEAFDAGLQAARMVAHTPIRETRGMKLDTEQELPWLIFADQPEHLQWRLPVEPEAVLQGRQTVRWVKGWLSYLAIGVAVVFASLLLQIASSTFWLNLVPIVFFFAPFYPSWRVWVPRRKLYALIALHALLFFGLLFIWMKSDRSLFFLYLILGLTIYFIILPMINMRKKP